MAGFNTEKALKEGLMIKRSQNKSKFTATNYKQRWFVLTPDHLVYYEGDLEVS